MCEKCKTIKVDVGGNLSCECVCAKNVKLLKSMWEET